MTAPKAYTSLAQCLNETLAFCYECRTPIDLSTEVSSACFTCGGLLCSQCSKCECDAGAIIQAVNSDALSVEGSTAWN
jgi:hypothetical protein